MGDAKKLTRKPRNAPLDSRESAGKITARPKEEMANTRSALKRVRQNKVRNARNKALKSRIKGARKALVAAIDSGNASDAETRYRDFISIVDRSVKANLSHRNSSSRIKSIFASRVKALNS